MTTSPRLRVHRRDLHGPGALLGEARLILPRVAQVLPPLDAELARTPHRADELIVVIEEEQERRVDVTRLRPATLSYAEAERLAAEHQAAGLFTATTGWMVALELDDGPPPQQPVHDPARHNPDDPCDDPEDCRIYQPWWCKVFCVSGSCDNC